MTEEQPYSRLLDRLNAAADGDIVWEWFGGLYPVQGEGRTSDGEYVYFRFRYNCAQLYIGDVERATSRLYCELEDVFTGPDGGSWELRGWFEDDDEAFELVERMRADLRPVKEATTPRIRRIRRHLELLQDYLERGKK